MPTNYALYFHIPFCVHRCAYCDFNTYAGCDALIPAYVDALVREIEVVAQSAPEKLSAKTIFFGGGTPSLLSTAQFQTIFDTIRVNFELSPDSEISLETNPGTLTREYVQGLYEAGLNRISMGVQSSHPDELRMLERNHSYEDVISATLNARKAGFENLSFDLIYALPEQTLERWQATVKLIVGLRPEHLSLYALTIEDGTPFGHWADKGLLSIPDPDLAAEMYEWASDFLEAKGFAQYEISNWARNGYQSQHNLQYWRNLPYLGFGAGAHGYADGTRYSNALHIQTYIDHLITDSSDAKFPLSPAALGSDIISPKEAMQEQMMMGLRLTQEGVAKDVFYERFGQALQNVFESEIKQLMGYGLLEWGNIKTSESDDASEVLRLTKQARLLGNQVFQHFVD